MNNNDDILDLQKQKLRLEMSHKRLLISRQLSPATDHHALNAAAYPRSITMRLLQARPDLALNLLSKLGALLFAKKRPNRQPLASNLLNMLPLLVSLLPLITSAVSKQKTNQQTTSSKITSQTTNQTSNPDGAE